MKTTFWQQCDSIRLSPPLEQSKQTQLNILRTTYYQHLSAFDVIAKTVGEMGFLKQAALYAIALALSAAGILFVNPICFIIGVLALNILWFLALHFSALEARFLQLVDGLEQSEKRVGVVVAEYIQLEQDLKKIGVEQENFVDELIDSRSEIKDMLRAVQKNKEAVQGRYEVLEQAVRQSALMIQQLGDIEVATAQKGAQCVSLLQQMSDVATVVLNDLTKIAENPMENELAVQNEYLSQLEISLDQRYGSLF